MPQITFTANLQRHVRCPAMHAEGTTLREVLDGLFAQQPQLRSYLVDEQGRLRRHVNIFINEHAAEDRLRLSDPVAADDEIYVFQALSGG